MEIEEIELNPKEIEKRKTLRTVKEHIYEFANGTIVQVWRQGSQLRFEYFPETNNIEIVGNREAFISLAEHLLQYAYSDCPDDFYIHYGVDTDLDEPTSEVVFFMTDDVIPKK